MVRERPFRNSMRRYASSSAQNILDENNPRSGVGHYQPWLLEFVYRILNTFGTFSLLEHFHHRRKDQAKILQEQVNAVCSGSNTRRNRVRVMELANRHFTVFEPDRAS